MRESVTALQLTEIGCYHMVRYTHNSQVAVATYPNRAEGFPIIWATVTDWDLLNYFVVC